VAGELLAFSAIRSCECRGSGAAGTRFVGLPELPAELAILRCGGSGKEAAALAVGASIFSSPAIGAEAVYFGALDGRFFSVEPRAPAS